MKGRFAATVFVLVCGVALAVVPAGAMAGDRHWTGAGTGGNTAQDPSDPTTLWDQPGNWQEGSPPGASDNASLQLTDAGFVNAQTATVGYLYMDNGPLGGALCVRGGVDFTVHTIHLGFTGGLYGRGIQTGGSLSAVYEYVGYSGEGTFTQSGGTNSVTEFVGIADRFGANGTYNLLDGSLSAKYQYVGYCGTGTFTQDGGSNILSGCLSLAEHFGSNGTYSLSGGLLSVSKQYVGYYGTGTFTQSGGTNTIDSDLVLGQNAGAAGTYSISGGQLSAGPLYVGRQGSGTFGITNPAADVTVSELLCFGADSHFSAAPGAAIHMTGSTLENENTDAADLAGLSNLTLIFEGGTDDTDPFEVAGEDKGAALAGYAENFALGALTLGGADVGRIQLVDDLDNRPGWVGGEALYVMNLNVGAGSSLDLNGLNLYYLCGSIDPAGTVLGGTATEVPATIGDADLNDLVDYMDLGILASYYDLSNMTWGQGDFSGNGMVDYFDLGILSTHYGHSAGGAGGQVPEPTMVSLLILGGAALVRRRRRMLA